MFHGLAFAVFLGLMPSTTGAQASNAPVQQSPDSPPVAPGMYDPAKPMHIGGSVKPPVLLSDKNPEFSEEARKDHFNGSVEVYPWVGVDGLPSHISVVKGAGHGLDEKAVEAVRSYRFRPGMFNGVPVLIDLYVEVSFQFPIRS